MCVYDVYLATFERISNVLADARHGAPNIGRELRTSTSVEAPSAREGRAAGLARVDAESGQLVRDMDHICLALCEMPCEHHPTRRAAAREATPPAHGAHEHAAPRPSASEQGSVERAQRETAS